MAAKEEEVAEIIKHEAVDISTLHWIVAISVYQKNLKEEVHLLKEVIYFSFADQFFRMIGRGGGYEGSTDYGSYPANHTNNFV